MLYSRTTGTSPWTIRTLHSLGQYGPGVRLYRVVYVKTSARVTDHPQVCLEGQEPQSRVRSHCVGIDPSFVATFFKTGLVRTNG